MADLAALKKSAASTWRREIVWFSDTCWISKVGGRTAWIKNVEIFLQFGHSLGEFKLDRCALISIYLLVKRLLSIGHKRITIESVFYIFTIFEYGFASIQRTTNNFTNLNSDVIISRWIA